MNVPSAMQFALIFRLFRIVFTIIIVLSFVDIFYVGFRFILDDKVEVFFLIDSIFIHQNQNHDIERQLFVFFDKFFSSFSSYLYVFLLFSFMKFLIDRVPLYFFDFMIEEWLAKNRIHPVEGEHLVEHLKKRGMPNLYDFSKIMQAAQKEISNIEKMKSYPKSIKMLYKKYNKG